MKTLHRSVYIAALLCGIAVQADAGELRLSIANGRVTLVAHDVSVRQILDEWARIGQTRIVNGDKLMGPPVTLELTDVPEAKALETVLRSASGYVLAPRSSGLGPSVYDRIMILPTSRAPVVSASAPPAPFNRAPMPQPAPAVPVDDDDGEPKDQGVMQPGVFQPGMVPPPVNQPVPGPGMPPQPGQMVPVQPGQQMVPVQPGQMMPSQPGAPGPQQQAPITAPRPGMLPATPQVPGNPYQPPPPTVPARRPGGGQDQ